MPNFQQFNPGLKSQKIKHQGLFSRYLLQLKPKSHGRIYQQFDFLGFNRSYLKKFIFKQKKFNSLKLQHYFLD